MKARVLVADDHSLIRTGILALLADEVEVIGQVEDGRTLVTEALRLRPDLIVLDVSMPNMNGIEAARRIRQQWPEARLLFVTMHADPMYLREALHAGAQGYLLKSVASDELVSAVRRVLKGEVYLSDAIPQKVRDSLFTATGRLTRNPGLTDRQREVLQLLAEGRGNKEIAAVLQLSVKTVEFHRGQVMRVLGVHTTAELTQIAVRLGLVGR